MHIAIIHDAVLPAIKYGGTERVVWWIAKALVQKGHKVTLISGEGTVCPFADVIVIRKEPEKQVPASADVVHIHSGMDTRKAPVPYIYTMHGNTYDFSDMDLNRVFVSKSHAALYGSTIYVHNGIDPEDYGDPAIDSPRRWCHFLGMASWKVKNVSGAISIAKKANVLLNVMGGHRLSLSKPLRLTLNPLITFAGMTGGAEKNAIMRQSMALLFPVLWSEPFGLAITESLYFGCPVLGTPYGSLPELVTREVGLLSQSSDELAVALKNIGQFSRKTCHQYVMDLHTSSNMADAYIKLYEKVMNGETLHQHPPRLTSEAAAATYYFK